jgi:hypothetical protein
MPAASSQSKHNSSVSQCSSSSIKQIKNQLIINSHKSRFRFINDAKARHTPSQGIRARSFLLVMTVLEAEDSEEQGGVVLDLADGPAERLGEVAANGYQAWLGSASGYHQCSLTSSPWLPSGPVNPNGRSLPS